MKPYDTAELNNLELRSIIVSGVTIYSGLYYLTEDLSLWTQLLFFALICAANAYFLGYWVFGLAAAGIDKVARVQPKLIHMLCRCCPRFVLAAEKALEKEYDLTDILKDSHYSPDVTKIFTDITRHDLGLQLYLMESEGKVFPKNISHSRHSSDDYTGIRIPNGTDASVSISAPINTSEANHSHSSYNASYVKNVNPSDSHDHLVVNVTQEPEEQTTFINNLRQSIEIIPLDTQEDEDMK